MALENRGQPCALRDSPQVSGRRGARSLGWCAGRALGAWAPIWDRPFARPQFASQEPDGDSSEFRASGVLRTA